MSFVIHILENVAAQVALPALSYVCEVADDGVVLAGVELELPTHGDFLPADRRFFWAAAGTGSPSHLRAGCAARYKILTQRVWQLEGLGMGIYEWEFVKKLDLGSRLLIPFPSLVCGSNYRWEFYRELHDRELLTIREFG